MTGLVVNRQPMPSGCESVTSSHDVVVLRGELTKLWSSVQIRMGKCCLPGLVPDIIADCQEISLWQVEVILPLLAQHVQVLDRN